MLHRRETSDYVDTEQVIWLNPSPEALQAVYKRVRNLTHFLRNTKEAESELGSEKMNLLFTLSDGRSGENAHFRVEMSIMGLLSDLEVLVGRSAVKKDDIQNPYDPLTSISE